MPFILIKGTYHVVGYSPDGDSVRFQADNPDNWWLLDGPPVGLNARGHAQLRIEAIDTLETHYGRFHQPLKLAKDAMNFLFAELGIKNVKFTSDGSRVISAQDNTRGYIMTRTTERNNRPVCFVFAGDPKAVDGTEVFLRANQLEASLNYKQARQGLAYPTYYDGLFPDLRKKITTAVKNARQGKKGVWLYDKTNKGLDITSIKTVTDQEVIMPKLFRRIIDYIGNGGGIEGFKEYLAMRPENVLNIKNSHFTHFDTFVEVTGKNVKVTVEPENLVFMQ